MMKLLRAAKPPALVKWCGYAVVLLLPGSFVALPLWWYFRHRAAQRAERLGS